MSNDLEIGKLYKVIKQFPLWNNFVRTKPGLGTVVMYVGEYRGEGQNHLGESLSYPLFLVGEHIMVDFTDMTSKTYANYCLKKLEYE